MFPVAKRTNLAELWRQQVGALHERTTAVDPEQWAGIDSARARAGGWWAGMSTIRVRILSNELAEEDCACIEVNIKSGLIFGTRIVQPGVHLPACAHGPHLTWGLIQFLEWFQKIDQLGDDVELWKEVWIAEKHQWGGKTLAQETTALLLHAFTEAQK